MEKLCVDLIGDYLIKRGGNKYSLNIKDVTMIDPETVWSKITQYDDKQAIAITNLVETTWLTRYHRPT